jgi:sarcosine oxidase, subunit gamma
MEPGSMAEPARMSVLAALVRAARGIAGPEPVTLAALPFRGKLIVRGGEAARARASATLGCELPGALRSASGDGVEALWLGPDEWLILVAAGGADRTASALRDGLSGLDHAVVDVSDRFAGISVEGARARDVLNAGVPLDLHTRAFPPGMVARTVLAKAPVVLRQPAEREAFELYLNGSLAPYAWLFLENAAREFGYAIAG